MSDSTADKVKALSELAVCVKALLNWQDDEGYLRRTSGSHKQLALVRDTLLAAEEAEGGERRQDVTVDVSLVINASHRIWTDLIPFLNFIGGQENKAAALIEIQRGIVDILMEQNCRIEKGVK